MRLRILELPPHHLGEASEIPFVLVFDRCSGVEALEIGDQHERARTSTGAAGVLVFENGVDFE